MADTAIVRRWRNVRHAFITTAAGGQQAAQRDRAATGRAMAHEISTRIHHPSLLINRVHAGNGRRMGMNRIVDGQIHEDK
ncbi:hypothetical protein D3C79_1001170 [compost metagenome]